MARDVYREMAAEDFDGNGFYTVNGFACGEWRSSEPFWCGSAEELAEALEEAAAHLDNVYGFYGNLHAGHLSDDLARELGYM